MKAIFFLTALAFVLAAGAVTVIAGYPELATYLPKATRVVASAPQ